MFSMLFSVIATPLGRYILIGGAVILVLFGVYVKIRDDAVADIEAAATTDVLKRTTNAIRSGDAVDLSPDRLREHDRNERD